MKWYAWLGTIAGAGVLGYLVYKHFIRSTPGGLGVTETIPPAGYVGAKAPSGSMTSTQKSRQSTQSAAETALDQTTGEPPGILGSLWNSWAGMF